MNMVYKMICIHVFKNIHYQKRRNSDYEDAVAAAVYS